MSAVSMLIMVATQAISSVLALRGKNLRDGLQALFLRLVSTLDASKARDLAESILKRPTISDSSLSSKGWMPEPLTHSTPMESKMRENGGNEH